MLPANFARSRSSLFDEEPAMTKSTSSALFADDDNGGGSPWDMPTPRKQQSHADLLRNLLPASEVPDGYADIFDAVVREGSSGTQADASGVARTLAAARLSADEQARIMSLVVPRGSDHEVAFGRNEFNVLLALIGLAQEGEAVNLDSIDERRRSKC
jgi:sorting nexin-8